MSLKAFYEGTSEFFLADNQHGAQLHPDVIPVHTSAGHED